MVGHLFSGGRTLFGRLFSVFRPNNYHTQDAPPRTRLLERARNTLSRTPHRHDEGIEVQDRRSAVVDVPFTRGKQRNVSAAEVRTKRQKQKQKAKNAKNASAGHSRPPHGSVTQQFGGAAEAQPSSSDPHAAAPTPPTTPGVASVATTRWTRFWLTACCMSAQYPDGHH
ncbi:hypothetical protein K503DRAFT_129512 [Rhizopogon vinicolor AM-OR11-026]|uniref:Uncharacterized protein n=1 Tax=Rhizopogon vinicolor AM-OR11-026 TaxID=1314800 RepID=A0A1B7MEL7_9AGAM|nr:hypothetical protein K503DRAFT_129512 [Rhizopogon vinicolor AM-OR11-026]